MRNVFIYLFLIIGLNSCFKGTNVDLIIHNGRIHVMDEKLQIFEAIAIKDGEIVQVGPEREILNAYTANKVINAKKKDVFPGFHDAHGHIYSLAHQMQTIDLRETKSYRQMITELEKSQQKSDRKILFGRGWDQSIWGEEKLPDNRLLNEFFPDIPVALVRIDGHAMLANDAMLQLAGITRDTEVDGGVIERKEGKETGILLDYAIDLVMSKIPRPSEESLKEAVLKIQADLFALGITHVHEAGLHRKDLQLFIDLVEENKLDLNVYAMLYPSKENFAFADEQGHYHNKNLSVRSFKIVADGSLGSHGACMLQPYSDSATHGILLSSPQEIYKVMKKAKDLKYQVNSHCIGDSANRTVLINIDTMMHNTPDHRWRIEHAQVIHPNDFQLFGSSGALPSVQPTHATTDQRWAEKHIGEERLKGAYAYNSLQKQSGLILFGTDFPVESFNPFATIHAAVHRKTRDNEPIGGFLPKEAVSLKTTLKAMTTWAAYGCFEENKVGTLEKGKKANLVILDHKLEASPEFKPNYAYMTIVNGKIVFSME